MGIEYFHSESFSIVEIKTCSDDIHAYKNHLHREFSLGFIERGSTVLEVGSREYRLQAGDAILIAPFVSHKCQPVNPENWGFTMIYIPQEFVLGLFENSSELHAIGIRKLEPQEFHKLQKLVAFLKSHEERFHQEIALAEVLSDLTGTVQISIDLEDREAVRRIKEYMEVHFLDPLDLRALEKLFGGTKFALIKGFKAVYNTTPNAFQLQLKVEYAKRLLASQKSLAEVALAAGFYDQAYFSREFKKAYGITPLQYRRSFEE